MNCMKYCIIIAILTIATLVYDVNGANFCNVCFSCTDSSRLRSVTCGGLGYSCQSTIVSGGGKFTWTGECSVYCVPRTTISSNNGVTTTTTISCCNGDYCNTFISEASIIKPFYILLTIFLSFFL